MDTLDLLEIAEQTQEISFSDVVVFWISILITQSDWLELAFQLGEEGD